MMTSMVILLLALGLVCQFIGYASGQCPTRCACIRGNTRIQCSASMLTAIPDFPDDIRVTAMLLELGSNFITSINATDLQGFSNLETLDLSANRITSIEEGSFSSNTALESLDLSSNQLREIPDNLFESTLLFSLILSNNNIANISASTFTGVQVDASIDLGGNVIRTIAEDTFANVEGLDELVLFGNPLRCDCELRWFPAFNALIRVDVTATCAAPANVTGMVLGVLTEEQFMCDCAPMCMNGVCNTTVGECECNNGFLGEICDIPCPTGSFGGNCSQNCACIAERESSPCNNVDGTCNCIPGYTGPSCEQECPEGSFGQDCLDVCQCENGICDFITGFCNCSVGFTGAACNMICPPLRYGLGCSEVCSCEAGNCHHITGECSCPLGYFGSDCNHNCTEADNCGDIGREECSLSTPEQICGPCLPGYVGELGNGTSECILCSDAPNCDTLNRDPCSIVVNTCGPCFQRHLTTPGQEGFSNEPCFDPCIDGIINYNETDIDCGGNLCPPCGLNQVCTTGDDCGLQSVCLGIYEHPSRLDFPFHVPSLDTCVAAQEPGNAIAVRFMNALRGRNNPLPDIVQNVDFTLEELEESVEREIQEQFGISEPLESIAISDLDQAQGNPLYQTLVKVSEGSEESFDQMVRNIHRGKLTGTTIFNRRSNCVQYNF